jgi:hypothetical protein
MKHLLVMLLAALALSACKSPAPRAAIAPARVVAKAPVVLDADGVEIQRVAYRGGVSAYSVQKLANENGCRPSTPAALLTAPGPVEVYRLTCESGQVYMAQCAQRQCRKLVR